MKTLIIIPARYQSSRFPGKPLVRVLGKTMLERVYRIGCSVHGVSGVHIATDDERIAAEGAAIGASVIMTSPECRNGTERVAEAFARIGADADLVINLQGDAPLTPPHFIRAMIDVMADEQRAAMATPAVRCTRAALKAFKADRRAGRVGGTTVVADSRGYALYFSKEVVPYTPEGQGEPTPVLHHVGLYAFRPPLLARYASAPPCALEQLEGLEQLRVLDFGEPIRVVEVDGRGRPFWEINNPEDVARVEGILSAHGEA